MVIPRYPLLALWAVATAAIYYFPVYTNVGNYAHGGKPLGHAVLAACLVLSCFFCLEIVRTNPRLSVRVAVGIVGAPAYWFLAISLYSAAKTFYHVVGP